MKSAWTIEQMQARYDEFDARDERWNHVVMSPDEAGLWLATPKLDGCLTHIVRAVVYWTATYYEDPSEVRRSLHFVCGQTSTKWRIIEPDDEFFVCGRCAAKAPDLGLRTFNLVPTTGCEVSGGRRGRRFPLATLPA